VSRIKGKARWGKGGSRRKGATSVANEKGEGSSEKATTAVPTPSSTGKGQRGKRPSSREPSEGIQYPVIAGRERRAARGRKMVARVKKKGKLNGKFIEFSVRVFQKEEKGQEGAL